MYELFKLMSKKSSMLKNNFIKLTEKDEALTCIKKLNISKKTIKKNLKIYDLINETE